MLNTELHSYKAKDENLRELIFDFSDQIPIVLSDLIKNADNMELTQNV